MTQRGFTLLELMVAMAIFASLAVAGWQVFDSVNHSRELAQRQASRLSELQFAYLQLQQDFSQIVPYQIAIESASNDTNQDSPIEPKPFAKLNSNSFRFIRFADPDPRFQSSPVLERVDYVVEGDRLIRRQYLTLSEEAGQPSLDSVILTQISQVRWQAYLPKLSATFPNDEANLNPTLNNPEDQESPPLLLPKGVQITFLYQGDPITWQWAIVADPISFNQKTVNQENRPASPDLTNPNSPNRFDNANNLPPVIDSAESPAGLSRSGG